MTMKILKVILENPFKSFKGDAKLLKGRADALSERGQEVSILFFRVSFCRTHKKAYIVRDRIQAVCISISVWRILANVRFVWQYRRMPIQCLASYVLRESLRVELGELFLDYSTIHFYHIRTIGLFELATDKQRVVADLIDSYTYNLKSRISNSSRLGRYFWNTECKKIERVERNLWKYLGEFHYQI